MFSLSRSLGSSILRNFSTSSTTTVDDYFNPTINQYPLSTAATNVSPSLTTTVDNYFNPTVTQYYSSRP
jgi:hypothetical protein